MPSTYQVYTADGATTSFPVPFEFIDPSYVKAKVNGVDADGGMSDGFFELLQTPAVASTVVIYRETPVNPLVVFSDRTTVDEGHLDLVVKQFSNTIEETQSGFLQTYGSGIDPDVDSPDEPTIPTNVESSSLFTSINVTWDKPTFTGFKHTEVWRSETDDFATAEMVYVTIAGQITDVVGYDSDYFYWVRHVNTANQIGPTQGDGVVGSTPDSAFSDDYLNELITSSGTGLADQIANANAQIARITETLTTAHGHIITIDERLTTTEDQAEANASALSSLDTRVESAETTITSQATALTQLQTDVDNITNDGQAAAIESLDTRVTSNETDISSNASSITQLQTDATSMASDISGNSSAIGSLGSRVDATESSISSQASDITQLQSDVSAAQNDASANATAISNLDTRTSAAEGTITSQASQLSSLSTSVGDNQANITTLTSSVNGLSAQWELKTDVNGLVGGVGFYNDGGTTTFAISNDGVNGLVWDGATLTVRGDIEATSVAAGAIDGISISGVTMTGSTIQTAATGNRAVIDKDNNLMSFYWQGNGQSSVKENVRIGGLDFTDVALDIGGTDFNGQGIRVINTGAFTGDFEGNTSATVLYARNDHGYSGCRSVRSIAPSGRAFEGSGGAYDFYAAGAGANYGPFTGAHDALLPKTGPLYQEGDIVKVVDIPFRGTLSNILAEVELEDSSESKNVFGALVWTHELPLYEHRPVAMLNVTEPEYDLVKADYFLASVNGVGEGQINVCDEGGNLERGDFITTSTVVGKGKLYSGSDMRVVLARALEPVDWSQETGTEKTIACIYLCG